MKKNVTHMMMMIGWNRILSLLFSLTQWMYWVVYMAPFFHQSNFLFSFFLTVDWIFILTLSHSLSLSLIYVFVNHSPSECVRKNVLNHDQWMWMADVHFISFFLKASENERNKQNFAIRSISFKFGSGTLYMLLIIHSFKKGVMNLACLH